jgi:hypothetical protein
MTFTSAEFHDAELRAVEIGNSRETLALKFLGANGETMYLRFEDCSFRAIDIIPQNVVSRLLLSSEHRFSAAELLHWMTWITGLSDASSFCTPEQISKLCEEVSSGSRTLCVIEPSWGAEFAVLAKAVTIASD